MKPEIASLQERMKQGGDWRAFRDEIASLHNLATTEDEYVTLLEAFDQLVAVGPNAFDAETWTKLLPVTEAEYKKFLLAEAYEGDFANPALLDRITRREIEAGRLAADSDFRKLAEAGGAILGDTGHLSIHACRNGDWFTYGVLIAAVAGAGLAMLKISPLWLVILGLIIGYLINERERKRIKKDVAANRGS